ncbi:MAG: hypothetical protein ABSD73_06350 [Candidatus Bathyarchaeia archaeon]|jgi:hypothetical protein
MNSNKEVLAASILAIGLALGLGTASYGLFSGTPTPTKLETVLDVFTQKGGIGINVSGGNFEPFDNVSILAYLTQGGIKLENRTVTFSIQKPDDTHTTWTASTNDSGLAETDVSLLPSEGHMIGTWHVLANATVDNEAVNDTLDFKCESQSAQIDLFSERNGVPSISFLPNETVLLEAQLSYRNASIAGTTVTFAAMTAKHTEFLLQNVTTNSLGTTNVTFRIPWPSDLSLGIWQLSAASEVYGQILNATMSFGCYLQPQVIDVFTQKGGVGPNASGGSFALNETVVLYAEVRDELNQTVSYQVVGFYLKEPNGTDFAFLTQTTNSSGMVNVTIRVPPDPTYVGTFEVYARTQYYGIVLLDTLTFVATQD